MYQRRDFLKISATGIALTAITGKLLGCNSSSMLGSTGSIKEFGLQLYTLRDVLPNNPKSVLKQVAGMGYKQIESYPHNKLGIFWGMTNIEFKKYMDSLGMQIVASHCGMKDFEKTAADAAEIGMKYLLFGSLDNEKGMDRGGYKKAAELLNEKGEICKRNGIKFAYHNHDQTFTQRTGGFIPQEVLLENTDPALVDFEMDIYWTVTGGQNPETWLRKYPNRFKLCHIKDRKKGAPLSEREVSVNLGTGSIDFKKILKVAKENGMQYYIVEQEKYEGSTSLSAAKANAEYIKKLRI